MKSTKLTNGLLIAVVAAQTVLAGFQIRDWYASLPDPLKISGQKSQIQRMLPPLVGNVVLDESSGPPYTIHANQVIKSTGEPTHAVIRAYPDFLLLSRQNAGEDEPGTLFIPWSSVDRIEGTFPDMLPKRPPEGQ